MWKCIPACVEFRREPCMCIELDYVYLAGLKVQKNLQFLIHPVRVDNATSETGYCELRLEISLLRVKP